MSRRRVVPVVAALLALSVAACGSSSKASSATTTTAAVSATSTTAAAATSGKVSANDATRDEIAAALTAAGVPNANRWAGEVVEYRPYDKTDTNLTKLRDNLAKYNPDPAVLEEIIGALHP